MGSRGTGKIVRMLLTFVGIFGTAAAAFSQTADDFSRMATKSWAAFECAALASFAGNFADGRSLTVRGYEAGYPVIEALRSGKIDREALRKSDAPLRFSIPPDGPNSAFVLGVISADAGRIVLTREVDPTDSMVERSHRAKLAFERKNCRLF